MSGRSSCANATLSAPSHCRLWLWPVQPRVSYSLETRESLVRFGARAFLPAVIIFSIVKESGPIITGLVVSGRAGAGIGAELGSMKVTEQIDAMEASAVDPYKYLAATRVAACTLMHPLLTIAACACGIFMGWLTNTLSDPISLHLFLDHGFKNVAFSDYIPPVFKTLIFGLIIGLVGCFQGMRTSHGTEGVGRGDERGSSARLFGATFQGR